MSGSHSVTDGLNRRQSDRPERQTYVQSDAEIQTDESAGFNPLWSWNYLMIDR